jgi:hypothetical protein
MVREIVISSTPARYLHVTPAVERPGEVLLAGAPMPISSGGEDVR